MFGNQFKSPGIRFHLSVNITLCTAVPDNRLWLSFFAMFKSIIEMSFSSHCNNLYL